MTTPTFLTLDMPCDLALQVAKRKLSQSGLRALQTFDLQTARHTQQDCPCPHHGTVDCDCQLVVLLVYGTAPEPATLILHSSDGQTRFAMADDPSQRADAKLAASIQAALDVKTAVSI